MVEDVVVIIQARMDSERLPGKVMLPVNGVPLIGILINRLKQIRYPLIVATSLNKENDSLEKYVSELGFKVFRGSEDNVLERFYFAAKEMNAKIVVRLTGDNPLLDADFLNEKIDLFIMQNNTRAYMSTSLSCTFPLGISVEIFSFELLEEAFKKAVLSGEKEHVTPYMYQNKAGNIDIISLKSDLNKYQYRLTVDTVSDFEFVKTLIEKYDCAKKSVEEIIEIVDNNTELLMINGHNTQKKWDE